jgi:hypothetical protein
VWFLVGFIFHKVYKLPILLFFMVVKVCMEETEMETQKTKYGIIHTYDIYREIVAQNELSVILSEKGKESIMDAIRRVIPSQYLLVSDKIDCFQWSNLIATEIMREIVILNKNTYVVIYDLVNSFLVSQLEQERRID